LSATGASTTEAIANSGLLYDGQYLTLYGGQRISTETTSVSSNNVVVSTVASTSGVSAHFDYVVRGVSSNQRRAGVVMCVWDGVTTAYTDNSTPDINGSTLPLTFSTGISGGDVLLFASSSSGTWTIVTGVRIIF
jgi:hypothetical protein